MLMWPSHGWPKDPLSIASEPFNANLVRPSFKGLRLQGRKEVQGLQRQLDPRESKLRQFVSLCYTARLIDSYGKPHKIT
jgi:hypothetical protein